MPTPPAPRRLHEHPMPDRAAGALLGPLVAAALVGVPPRQAAHLATTITTPPPTPDPDHLAHLLRFALHQGHTPHHPPTAPIARTWAQALHTLVHTRTPPTTAPELEHTPTTDPHSASWQALTHTPYPPHEPAHGSFACTHLTRAIHAAHRAGGHQAALYTGALTGARWGASALPLQALRRLSEHTDPHTLTRTALDLITPTPDPHAWPHTPLRSEDGLNPPTFAVAHPLDPHVLLGNLAYLRSRPDHVDAVVSLCRTHPHDAPHLAGPDWIRVWLHDTPDANTNVHFTLDQAADAVATLRAEGKRVLVHCWAGASRTPAVATRYAITALDAPPLQTMATMIRTVGGHLDNPSLSRAVADLSGLDLPDPAQTLFDGRLPPRRPDLHQHRTRR